jgi:Tfp pilus assembly protein PilO
VKKDPKKLLLVALAGSFLLLVVGFLAVVHPKLNEASQIASQIDDVRNEIDQARGATVPSKEQAIKVADLFQLSRAMPDTNDVSGVLFQLSQLAEESGITFTSFSPKDPTSNGTYMVLPIDLVLDGGFYEVSDFLYRMRNLVDVHSGQLETSGRLFSISSLAFGEGQNKFPQVEATMEVDAYVYGTGTPNPSPLGGPVYPSGASAQGPAVVSG